MPRNQGLQVTLTRCGDDDLLGTSLDVAGSLLSLHEETSGLDDVFHTHVL